MKIIKIAVISDTHGNFPALSAAFEDIRREDCEKIYHLGDAIAIGAYSAEVMEMMMHYNVKLIMGNHEAFILSDSDDKPRNMSEGEFVHQKWIAGTLSRLHRRVIKNCVLRHDEIINGYRIAFMHYALEAGPVEENKFKDFEKNINSENIDDLFGKLEADIVFFGHLHKILDITGKSGVRYINPGALGCQKDDLADYCLATISNGVYEIDFRKVRYNKTQAIEELDNRNVPEREYIKRVFYGVE